MRGRQVFMDSLVAHGTQAIFGNPGTTENPLLDSLLDYPDITYYVALHEGIAVGAASYYARASGKTAVANLHVAPGLGNAIGMIYGALKGAAPMIVTAGQQDTRMRLRDPVLRHDLVAMAQPVTKWAVEAQYADEIAPIMRRAFKIAIEPPAGPVFVALPINVMEQETDIGAVTAGELYPRNLPAADGVARIVELLVASERPAIVTGDEVVAAQGSTLLTRLVELTGAAVFTEFLRTSQPIANHHPNLRGRIPPDGASIAQLLSAYDCVLLLGGAFFEEIWFDAGDSLPPGITVAQIESAPSRLAHNYSLDAGVVGHLPECLRALLSGLEEKVDDTYRSGARQRNAEFLSVNRSEADDYATQFETRRGAAPMSPGEAFHAIATTLPDDVLIVDETVTSGTDMGRAFALDQNNFYSGRGGGIGQGLAGALGVSIARPQHKVVVFSGDGSAMYSIQALWTAAHHELDILFVILSNREYRVLKHNLDIYRSRFKALAERPYPHMDLTHPELGFANMARGMGVEARTVASADDITSALAVAQSQAGPFLLDVLIAGKP
jgi:benzoylformate decarboxylase